MIFDENRRWAVLVCALTAVLSFFCASDAFAKEIKIAPDQECASAECHEGFGTKKYIHEAMEDNDCSSCHEQDSDEHVFEYPDEDDELCLGCHDAYDQKKNKHEALEDGCITCHSPHESDTEFMLDGDSMAEVCFMCHDESMAATDFVHYPVEEGECTSCHNPHESDNSSLLLAESPAVCFECHDDKGDEIEEANSVHAAAEDDCLNCHSPHGESREYFLIEDVPTICFECHDDVEEHIEASEVKHGIVGKDKLCMNCHNPHTSENDSLILGNGWNGCLECHDDYIALDNGKELEEIKSIVEDSEFKHGPVQDGECVACHDPHGSNYYRILKGMYPERYYASFNFSAFGLCFTCHDKDLMLNEVTEDLTGFRDGARNLHFLHVNRKDKGRKCTNCHDAHASSNSKHIRESVMFGQWDMEIAFEKTETGGSCNPGCHKSEPYDRVDQVNDDWKKPVWEEIHFK
jgi:predicted CXXCH cytochrome family protein